MAIREYFCKVCGKWERLEFSKRKEARCPSCGRESERVEFSVPARRNPKHGEQR